MDVRRTGEEKVPPVPLMLEFRKLNLGAHNE